MKTVTADQIREISGVDTRKCMKCGRCSASCPAYDEMDIRPHQFISYVQNGNIEPLMNSKSISKCLSCFACVERCPRNVKPAKVIEAVRVSVLRQRGETILSADEMPELLDENMPQQLLMSAFRKYKK
ncbi:MAG: 4Fe-4S dicluster domain-containing protein [Clostridia bacterium]|nr:4Fe-4S dicluster domain-containing protein [Clostridia bacterium]